MKKLIILLPITILILGCSANKNHSNLQAEQFTNEIRELMDFFKIPGLAVSIHQNGENIYQEYFGVSDVEKNVKLDSTALFPIASLTKVISGVLILKLVEQGKFSLDDPVNEFLPKPMLGDSILVKHILSHTSQGNPGEKFYYSSRYDLLTYVIEKSSGQPFSEILHEEVIVPLKLQNTFLLNGSTKLDRIATPYMLHKDIRIGTIDRGYSASTGIVSNLKDLAIFNEALDSNKIINNDSKDLMFSSFKKDLPYGYGVFNQKFENQNIVWAYGQNDSYSSLFLKIPAEKITLTLLANNNSLSDPARLINGDATSSLFVISFLKNYILGLTEMPLLEKQKPTKEIPSGKEFYRKKILAQALAESYMAKFAPEKIKTSINLLDHIFSRHQNYLQYADLNLLHNLSLLKNLTFSMDLGDFNGFDTQIEQIGNKLLEKEPYNPYVHMYLGIFNARKENEEKAKIHFKSILNAKNFSNNWYTEEARQWLNEYP